MDNENCTNSLDCVDNSRNTILYKMYVSNVGNRLREMDTPSDIDCQRWPWELMQNAKDSISGSNRDTIDIILTVEDDYVIFQHDGNPFNGDSYLALLYKYSDGKKDNSESTGRFGTGFLTTHSLSKVVNIEGPIYDQKGNICGFEVTMYRDGKNDKELIEGMNKMEKEKKFWSDKRPKWTKFKYFLKTQRNKESSILGVNNFKENIILTMIFNRKFNIIQLKENNKNLIFQKYNEEILENVEILTYSINDSISNQLLIKYYIHSKISEESKELTEHFDKKRYLNLDCAIEIDPIKKEIKINDKSPCLFCSLPLVGSESHILPFILNSNDFEPSTERQEILLDGAEFRKDENKNKEIPSDVGINRYILKRSYELFERITKFFSSNKYNNLHLLSRGLKDIPKVKKYFDEKWYEENYMKEMKEILYKYPIIYGEDSNLFYIKDIYFPIYDNYNPKFTKIYYELVKQLYLNIPRYEESIEWSKFLWEKDLKENRIDINLLIDKYNKSQLDFDFINIFVKFIFENYKPLLKTKQILKNQENNFILYNEDKFAQSINVPEDIINCIEELGFKWRNEHLNNKINSIELPIKHDYDYAVNLIKKIIEEDKTTKSYILVRYVFKDNITRESMYYFSKLFFKELVKEAIYVQNFVEEIWKNSDEYLIENIISKITECKNLKKLVINIEDFNKLLNFLYYYNEKIFDKKKLLPNQNYEYEFCLLSELMYENNINQDIKKVVISYIDSDLNKSLLNNKIKINGLKIKYFNNDDLIEKIINYFKTNPQKNENKDEDKNDFIKSKFYISKCILNFLPKENLNDNKEQNNKIFKKYKDIRNIYKIICNNNIKNEELEIKNESIWSIISYFILEQLQEILNNLKISQKKTKENYILGVEIENKYKKKYFVVKNDYINLLNTYQSYFDFKTYKLLPNYYGDFLSITELEDYNDIPEDILNSINNSFHKDLKKETIMKGLQIENIRKRIITDIGIIISNLFNSKKGELNSNFNYKDYYDLGKCIIKYLPKENNREYQLRLYNLAKIFDENIGESKEIISNDVLYFHVNTCIIQFINESIENSKNIITLKNK